MFARGHFYKPLKMGHIPILVNLILTRVRRADLLDFRDQSCGTPAAKANQIGREGNAINL